MAKQNYLHVKQGCCNQLTSQVHIVRIFDIFGLLAGCFF